MNEDHLDAQAAHAERLLDQLQVVAGPSTWPLVEELVRTLLAVYGTGLERLVGVARENAASVEAFHSRLADDEALSGLLSLHGLHPLSTRQRIERAVARVALELTSAPATIEVSSVDGESVTLALTSAVDQAKADAYAQLVVRAVQRAAPEITDVRVDGMSSPPTGEVLIPAERLNRARS